MKDAEAAYLKLSFYKNSLSRINLQNQISNILLQRLMIKHQNALIFFFVLCFFSCAGLPRAVNQDSGAEIPAPPPVSPPSPSREEYFLTIVAAGDNLYHEEMIRDGEDGDYETIYKEIRPLVEAADIAFINQETLLAGKDFGFSGYPQFNTPQKVGRALAATGFNVVNHATNHIMDKGEKAVSATMDFWDTIPRVKILGIHRSEERRSLPVLVEKNNITVGFLSYTYGTNGIPVPAGKPYLVSVINTEIMAEEIDALRPLCDFLVVSMHWGEEYRHDYNKQQENLAAFLAGHRVDLVIGHHPHVIQRVENIQRPDGKYMLCYYSLGNLISAQSQTVTMLGAMAFIRIKKIPAKNGGAAFELLDAGAIPLVTHYEKNYTGFAVYPLYAYTDELADKHWKNQTKIELTKDYFTALAAKIFEDKEIKRNPSDAVKH